MTLKDLEFKDERFEQPGGWIETLADENFVQRYLEDEKLVYCETLMTVHGSTEIDRAVALLNGPWDWWEHGGSQDFVRHPDGSSYQVLLPVTWFITRVGLNILPPTEAPDGRGLRVPMCLTRDFTGPTSIDVYADPTGMDMIIRGRFHGVEYHVPLVPDIVAEKLHLNAESGTMPVPFPKGTGWVGLLHLLEPASVH